MGSRNVNVKELLRKIRTEKVEIRILLGKRETFAFSLYPSAIRYDRDRVQTSPKDLMSEGFAKICKLDMEIVKHIRAIENRRAFVMKVVREIEQPDLRLVLTLYYLATKPDGSLFKWEEVADAVHHDEKYVLHKLHPAALQEFKKAAEEMMREKRH